MKYKSISKHMFALPCSIGHDRFTVTAVPRQSTISAVNKRLVPILGTKFGENSTFKKRCHDRSVSWFFMFFSETGPHLVDLGFYFFSLVCKRRNPTVFKQNVGVSYLLHNLFPWLRILEPRTFLHNLKSMKQSIQGKEKTPLSCMN